MTLIQDLTQVFNQRLEVQNLLDEVVTQLANKLGYPQVRINLVEEDHLVLKAYYGPRPKLDRYPLEQGIIGQVARTGQAVLAPDVSLEPDYRPCIGQTIAEVAVPIFRGKSVVGVINIETDQKNQLSEQDRDLLQVLAGQISVALENAVLFERVRSHAEDLESKVLQRTAELSELFQLSQAIRYQLSYEELLRLILNHLSNAIRAEFVIGCLVSQDACLISVKTNRPIASALLEDIRNQSCISSR